MFEWLDTNKEWLFSGIFVTMGTTLVSGILRFYKTRNREWIWGSIGLTIGAILVLGIWYIYSNSVAVDNDEPRFAQTLGVDDFLLENGNSIKINDVVDGERKEVAKHTLVGHWGIYIDNIETRFTKNRYYRIVHKYKLDSGVVTCLGITALALDERIKGKRVDPLYCRNEYMKPTNGEYITEVVGYFFLSDMLENVDSFYHLDSQPEGKPDNTLHVEWIRFEELPIGVTPANSH